MTDRVMLDIETLGLDPGAAILSTGACRFTPGAGVTDTFYAEIDRATCLDAGLHVDEDTLEWWRSKDPALAPLGGETPLADALEDLSRFIGTADEVWANSPAFDCELLEAAYEAVGSVEPWEFYQERDVRTLRALPCAVELEMEGREHHALDDAVHQAREVAATIERVCEQ